MHEFDRFLLAVVYDIPNLLFVVDAADNRIIYANQHMRQIRGEVCVGQKFLTQFPAAGSEYYFVNYHWETQAAVLRSNPPFAQQCEYYDDESENWYNVLQRPIVWHDGTRKIVFVLHEINALKRLQNDFSEAHAALALKNLELETVSAKLKVALDSVEQKVAERTAELEAVLARLHASQELLASSEAKAALGTLIASVSHELKSPIGNAVLAASTLQHDANVFSQNLEEGGGNIKRSDLSRFIARIQEGMQLMLQSLDQSNQLLTNFRQVAADQVSEQRREFDLAQVVREIVASQEPSLRSHTHQVVVDIAPGIYMDSQPGPLGQIIINLINNAYLHAFEQRRDGVLTIHGEARGERVFLSFNDNGCGMSDDTLEHLFQPFFSTKIGKGGTGLGMTIVSNLVHKTLQGTLRVSSIVGIGTCIEIDLPRVLPHAAP